jgi:hypothetical protein
LELRNFATALIWRRTPPKPASQPTPSTLIAAMELLKVNLHKKPKKANEYRNNFIVGTKVAKLPRIEDVEDQLCEQKISKLSRIEQFCYTRKDASKK